MKTNDKKAKQGLKHLLIDKLWGNDYVLNLKKWTIESNCYTYYVDQEKIDDFCSENSDLLPYMIRNGDGDGDYKVFTPIVALLSVFVCLTFVLLSFLIVSLVKPDDILYCLWSIPTGIFTSFFTIATLYALWINDTKQQLSNILFEKFSKQVCGVDNLLEFMSLKAKEIADEREVVRIEQEKSKLVELLDYETNNERRAELILEILDKKINLK